MNAAACFVPLGYAPIGSTSRIRWREFESLAIFPASGSDSRRFRRHTNRLRHTQMLTCFAGWIRALCEHPALAPVPGC
jgi:hypothetical protein